jgi:hypothetical protein
VIRLAILLLFATGVALAQEPQPFPAPAAVPINIPQPATIAPQPAYAPQSAATPSNDNSAAGSPAPGVKIISPATAPTAGSLAGKALRHGPVTVWQPGTPAGLPIPPPVVAATTPAPPKPIATGAAWTPQAVQLGVNASFGGRRPFPADNPWNTDIAKEPVDPNSDALVASIGLEKRLHFDPSIPYVVVPGNQPKVSVEFQYPDESDPGPYPIPPDAPIEGGLDSKGDRHVLVVDRDNWKLYETFDSHPLRGVGGTTWKAGSGAIFDLASNALRPANWTSADAAGLPIFPGLLRYDEVVEQKEIRHALRFTCVKTRHAYVSPARHFASSRTDENLPPMGMRVRLKADFDITSSPPAAQIILTALKKYGLILADNGGDWFVTGTADSRWDQPGLTDALRRVRGRDFEVIKMGPLTTR